MLKYAFRDFFRRRRLARHTAVNGDRYAYHGCEVIVPERAGLGVRNSLLRERYEDDESAMIIRHLPADIPVIELGGSLGVVSALVRSRIGPSACHVIVEANPDLVDICAANAGRGASADATNIVNAAIFYDAPFARFRLSPDIHSSALDHGRGRGRVVEVPSVTLASLYEQLGSPGEFSLVSDIEGAEYAVFEREAETLARVTTAIIEVHPEAFERQGGSLVAFKARCLDLGLFLEETRADVLVFKR